MYPQCCSNMSPLWIYNTLKTVCAKISMKNIYNGHLKFKMFSKTTANLYKNCSFINNLDNSEEIMKKDRSCGEIWSPKCSLCSLLYISFIIHTNKFSFPLAQKN